MSLSPGTRLGPYVIEAPIGAGGMGEVYRATDTHLKRAVAIKVLPASVAGDAERLARFHREAEVLAALNHPNIAAIYGLERTALSTSSGQADVMALVMELVEGDDLSGHIARGPIALSEALPIAGQIADALEAAHEGGIIHRDLKPANVKVRADGTVKLLDFGLAKALGSPEGLRYEDGVAQGFSPAHSPTLTARATQMGMIVGTAAYMAPEQARGKAVDKRADIWAFGVVLYEMLTGARAFNPSRPSESPQALSRGEGDSVTDVLAAVLRQDIDWTALPAGTPPRLRRLLERCLDRDVKQRLRDIGEARVEIAKIESGAPDAADVPPPSTSTPRPSRREAIPWSVAGAAIMAAATLLYFRANAAVPDAAVVRLAFVPPAGLTFEAGRMDAVVVSPDGRLLVFTGRSTDGKRQLYVRALDGVVARLLQGTEE